MICFNDTKECLNEKSCYHRYGYSKPSWKNVEEFWENIKANKNGLSYVDQFDTENFPVKIVGAVKDFDCTEYIDKKRQREWIDLLSSLFALQSRLLKWPALISRTLILSKQAL